MASMNQEIQNVQNHQDEQRAFNVKLRKVSIYDFYPTAIRFSIFLFINTQS